MAAVNLKVLFILIFAAGGIVQATYDPSTKTKTYRPAFAHVYDPSTNDHEQNYQTKQTVDDERLSQTNNNNNNNNNQDQKHQHQHEHSLKTISPTHQHIHHIHHHQQQLQQQEIPLYERQRNVHFQEHERHGPLPTATNWQDTGNAANEYYTGCPPGHTGQLPYAYDCRRFLNCWNGNGHIQSCAPGTVFNADTLECDRPDKVVCGTLSALGTIGAGYGNAASTAAGTQNTRYRAGRLMDSGTENVQVLCPPGVTGLHQHPTDCTKFLNCANGNVHIQDCGPGTAFSASKMVCDFKHNVDCAGRDGGQITATNSYGLSSSSSSSSSSSMGYGHYGQVDLHEPIKDIMCLPGLSGPFVYPFDYTKFLNCKRGDTAIQSCVSGTVFSISNGYCDIKEKVRDTDHVSYVISQVSFEYSVAVNYCPPGTEGLHLYPFDCGRYIKCVNGEMSILECPAGSVYSITSKACLVAHQVARTDRVLSLQEVWQSQVASGGSVAAHITAIGEVSCPNRLSSTYPYPFDGTKYISCSNGKLKLDSCDAGSVYSLSKKRCELRHNVADKHFIHTHIEQWNLVGASVNMHVGYDITTITCPPGVDGLFLHPFDCTKFLRCSNGHTQIEPCGSNTVFSISKQHCTPTDQVDAFDRVEYLTEVEHEFSETRHESKYGHTTSNAHGISCPRGYNGLYPYPQDGNKYLFCNAGRHSIETCAPGRIFSISKRICQLENEVAATDRSTYLSTIALEQNIYENTNVFSTNFEQSQNFGVSQNAAVSCPPGASGMQPHPYDCTKFLNCDNGAAVVQSCGPGTAWNIAMEVCDFIANVDCASSGRSTSVTVTETIQGNRGSKSYTPQTTTTTNQWNAIETSSQQGAHVYSRPPTTQQWSDTDTSTYQTQPTRPTNYGHSNQQGAYGTQHGAYGTQHGAYATQHGAYGTQHGAYATQYGTPTATTQTNSQTAYKDRWTHMNMPRPDPNAQKTNDLTASWATHHHSQGVHAAPPLASDSARSTTSTSWAGSSIHLQAPTQSITYEEGSLQPGHTYVQSSSVSSVPLAPMSATNLVGGTQTTTTNTGTNLIYAQSAHDADAQASQFFSGGGTYVLPTPTYNNIPTNTDHRQNYGRSFSQATSTTLNSLVPFSSSTQRTSHQQTDAIDIPAQDLLPPMKTAQQTENSPGYGLIGHDRNYDKKQEFLRNTPKDHMLPPLNLDSNAQRPHDPQVLVDTTTNFNQNHIQSSSVTVPETHLMPPLKGEHDSRYEHTQTTLDLQQNHKQSSMAPPTGDLLPPHRASPQDTQDSRYEHTQTTLDSQQIHKQSSMAPPAADLLPPHRTSPQDMPQDTHDSRYEHKQTNLDSQQIQKQSSMAPPAADLLPPHRASPQGTQTSFESTSSGTYERRYQTTTHNYTQSSTSSEAESQPTVFTNDDSNLFGGLQPPLPTAESQPTVFNAEDSNLYGGLQPPLPTAESQPTVFNAEDSNLYGGLQPPLPTAESQPTVFNADDSNLYGGLQPPLPTVTTETTTPRSYIRKPTHATTPLPNTADSNNPVVQVPHAYPAIFNATVYQYPRDPHLSAPYASVLHSNTGLRYPYTTNKDTHISPSQTSYTIKTTKTTITTNTLDGNDLDQNTDSEALNDALKLLLRPYFNRSGTIDDDSADMANSHIMKLVAQPISTSTPDNTLSLPSNTPSTTPSTLTNPSETSHEDDVELILAGEQHHLTNHGHNAMTTPNHRQDYQTDDSIAQGSLRIQDQTNRHNGGGHNRNFHRNHPHLPNPFEGQEQKGNLNAPNSNYPHHNHHHHPQHHEHSRDFHQQHPNMPNPFAGETNSNRDTLNTRSINAESTTPRNLVTRILPVNMNTGNTGCEFNCGNGKCVKAFEVCDGVNNCGNRKDESKCEHLGYQVRLMGGEAKNMGRLEVKINGKWGFVCDDKFGLRDADVACKELGFNMGASEVRGNSFYAPSDVSSLLFVMDEVDCRGNETSLKDCEFKGWGVNNCGAEEVVGIVCKVPQLKCPNGYWLCSTSKECIPPAFVCDNTPDCADKSDESDQICNSPVEYRLEGGRSASQGRVEVKYRGEWGTVCDDDFGLKEAQVLCNSLGYYGRPKIEKNIFGPGSGPIWLDQVSCFGNETTIDKCNHWTWGEHNCNHTEDVGLTCTTGTPPRSRTQTNAHAPYTTTRISKSRDSDHTSIDPSLGEPLTLEDIGIYRLEWERSSKAARRKERRCGHFKDDLYDEYEHPEERVVNGSVAKRGRHPWQATIRTKGRGGISSHWCGAVLISKRHLLTAAHCLAGYPKGAYFVRMGDHYANIAEASETDSYIENWYIHEKFRDKTHMNNDIAVVVLKNPVRFNDYIQPICLPEKGAELEENRLCTISGWGSIKSGVSTPSNILRAAQLPILSDDTCKQSQVYGTAMSEGMFCAGYMDENVDACDGDSGGPLVCTDDGTETLYGIISWGQHCGYANRPGVYVRVEKYVDWILEKVNISIQQAQ